MFVKNHCIGQNKLVIEKSGVTGLHEEAASSAQHGPYSAFPSGNLGTAEMLYVHFQLQHTAY